MNPALFATVAKSLAAKHFGVDAPDAQQFPEGALVVDGDQVVVYRHTDADVAIGPVMLAATKASAEKVSVVVGDAPTAGILTRQATQLAVPPDVYVLDGTDIVVADPAEVPGVQEPTMADVELAHAAYEPHALELVVEAGIVRGELFGLEVSRVVDGVVEVGVGRFDREAGAMLRGTMESTDVLADALAQVAPHRTAEALPHPLNRLGRERWLRSVAVAEPSTVGLTSLAPVETVAVRQNLLDPFVAAGLGMDGDGVDTLAVFAAGLDTTALAHAADLTARHAPERVVVAIPEADMLPALTALYPLLAAPTEVVGMAAPWPR